MAACRAIMTVGLMDMSIIYRAVLPQVMVLPASSRSDGIATGPSTQHLCVKLQHRTLQGQVDNAAGSPTS